jgi:hypothetical protein
MIPQVVFVCGRESLRLYVEERFYLDEKMQIIAREDLISCETDRKIKIPEYRAIGLQLPIMITHISALYLTALDAQE